jgi:hypothetical protein
VNEYGVNHEANNITGDKSKKFAKTARMRQKE